MHTAQIPEAVHPWSPEAQRPNQFLKVFDQGEFHKLTAQNAQNTTQEKSFAFFCEII